MISRRDFVAGSVITGAVLAARASLAEAQAEAGPQPGAAGETDAGAAAAVAAQPPRDARFAPVITPNGAALPWRTVNGVKVFHLIAGPVEHEFAPGLRSPCWGYNGRTSGPTIEAVEGDRVRFYVTNKLPEPTSLHWHGIILPNGMDGVGGLTQRYIRPGETFKYEFTLRHPGTFMYHPHVDEMTQMGMGLMGMFIVHPRSPARRVDRDFVLLLSEWMVEIGASRPDPREMTNFNVLTINSKAFPLTEPLVVRTGQRVRIRYGNLSAMHNHPMHIHGYSFRVTATDGGPVPAAAQHPETTVLVAVGQTRDIEFVADAPGDWALHCHFSHHVMNQMGHGGPNMLGMNREGLDPQVRGLLPGYMTMGTSGMAEMGKHMEHMKLPENSIPMRGIQGKHDYIEMGGMFTVLKVRDGLKSFEDPGWYDAPAGTLAVQASAEELAADGIEPG